MKDIKKPLKQLQIYKFWEFFSNLEELEQNEINEIYNMLDYSPIKEGIHTSFNKENVLSIITKKFPDFEIEIESDGEIYIYGYMDSEFENLKKMIRLCGWFISNIRINDKFEIYKEDNNYSNITTICIEPSRDFPISIIPKIMYHSSNSIFDKSILKKGLFPKSLNKIANHPTRICLTDDTKIVFTFKKSREAMESTNDKKVIYSIWKINGEGIKNLFSDINLRKNGFYTTININPKFITKIA